MEKVNRAELRGKPLDDYCFAAHIDIEFGENGTKKYCYCYGLYEGRFIDRLKKECFECGAYEGNINLKEEKETMSNCGRLTKSIEMTSSKPPCKVGDTVYCVAMSNDEEDPLHILTSKCKQLIQLEDGNFRIIPECDYLSTYIQGTFATVEQAKARLKEL